MGVLLRSNEATNRTEHQPNIPTERLSYKNLMQQIALECIKNYGETFRQISWLEDSPILDIAPYIQGLENNPNFTTLKNEQTPKDSDRLLDVSFEQLVKLAHLDGISNKVKSKLVRFGLGLIKKYLVESNKKPSTAFEEAMIQEHQKALTGQIRAEDSITRENGVHWQNCEWEHQNDEDTAKMLQTATATNLAYFLRNQMNSAGHVLGTYHDSTEYQKHIKGTYFRAGKEDPSQMVIEWDVICPISSLAKDLKKTFPTIPRYSDHDPNDQTASFAFNSTIPKLNHPDLLNENLNAIKIVVIDNKGEKWTEVGAKDFLTMSPKAIINHTSGKEMPDLKWNRVATLESYALGTNLPFIVRLNDKEDHSIKPYESDTTNYISIYHDKKTNRDVLSIKSAHLPKDGSPRNEEIQRFSSIFKGRILPPDQEFVKEISPDGDQVTIEQIMQTKTLKDLFDLLQLGKVVIGKKYQYKELKETVSHFNTSILRPRDQELGEFLTKSENAKSIRSHITQCLHVLENEINQRLPKDANNQPIEDVLKEISAILNPHLATIDVLSIASEDTCTSATCATPLSPNRKLATYSADKVEPRFRKIQDSLLLTTTERVLAKLGHGWQSTISVTTLGKEILAKKATRRISHTLLSKSLPFRQWSDLGPGLNQNWFVTALSEKIEELAAGAGVSGEYMTERIAFKEDFLAALPLPKKFDQSEIEEVTNLLSNEDGITTTKLLNRYNEKWELYEQLNVDNETKLLTILKDIARHDPRNTQRSIKLFLISLCYHEFSLIPTKAAYYTNQAIQEGITNKKSYSN